MHSSRTHTTRSLTIYRSHSACGGMHGHACMLACPGHWGSGPRVSLTNPHPEEIELNWLCQGRFRRCSVRWPGRVPLSLPLSSVPRQGSTLHWPGHNVVISKIPKQCMWVKCSVTAVSEVHSFTIKAMMVYGGWELIDIGEPQSYGTPQSVILLRTINSSVINLKLKLLFFNDVPFLGDMKVKKDIN